MKKDILNLFDGGYIKFQQDGKDIAVLILRDETPSNRGWIATTRIRWCVSTEDTIWVIRTSIRIQPISLQLW